MKKFLLYFLFFIIVAVGFYAFKTKTTPPPLVQETIVELPEDFVHFYKQFHEDSLYQMSHIIFPLEGVPSMVDSTMDLNVFRWNKEQWVIHKTFSDYNGTYIREFDNFNSIISERIYDTGLRFEMQKRYTKISDEWYLIYYAGMNLKSLYE